MGQGTPGWGCSAGRAGMQRISAQGTGTSTDTGTSTAGSPSPARCPRPAVRPPAARRQRWVPGAGRWVLGAGSWVLGAGCGAEVPRRGCSMAEVPAAPHRTTGSTLLHPLSALLGIPLDQVSCSPPRGDRVGSRGEPSWARLGYMQGCAAPPAQGRAGGAGGWVCRLPGWEAVVFSGSALAEAPGAEDAAGRSSGGFVTPPGRAVPCRVVHGGESTGTAPPAPCKRNAPVRRSVESSLAQSELHKALPRVMRSGQRRCRVAYSLPVTLTSSRKC